MKETILIFAGHSDDQTLGCGGLISRYSKEGKKVINIIFTNGAESLPWMRKDLVVKTRLKEAQKADKFLGAKETILLKLDESKLNKQIKELKIKDKIKKIIKKYKPSKIFTHAIYDLHNNHRSVHKVVLQAYDELKPKNCDLYTFDVWNPGNSLNLIKKEYPKMYVDITNTFNKKIKAIQMYKSQKLYTYQLLPSVYANAIAYGQKINVKYAECFYKRR